MKQRIYDNYLMLARITAPSFRFEGNNRSEPVHVITAVDDRHYPQQWDTSVELFADVSGDNLVGELPDGLDRRKDWVFAAYLKDRPNQLPLLVGLDAMPARVYRSSILPTLSKDFKTLVLNCKPSGLWEVTQRPPLVKFELQARIMREINDSYLGSSKKKLEPGTRVASGTKKELGVVIRVSETEIEIRPSIGKSKGVPVYAGGDEE